MPRFSLFLLAFYAALLFALNVWAEEPPCAGQGDNVVCTRAGFDVLIKKMIAMQSEGKQCAIKLDAAGSDLTETKAALEKCIASIPPPCPEPKKPSAWRTVSPVVAGILGGAILTASVAGEFSPSTRVTGSVVGLGLLSAGIVFSIP